MVNPKYFYGIGIVLCIVGIVLLVFTSERLKTQPLSQGDKDGYTRWYDAGVAILVLGVVVLLGTGWAHYRSVKKVRDSSALQ